MSAKRTQKKPERIPAWSSKEGELVAARLHHWPEIEQRFKQVGRECRDCLLCGSPACGSLVLSFGLRNQPTEKQGWWGTGLCEACYNASDSAGKVFAVAAGDIRLRLLSISKEQYLFGHVHTHLLDSGSLDFSASDCAELADPYVGEPKR